MSESKKIEPTDAMVEAGASSAWEEVNPGILGWNSISERHKEGCRRDARAVLTAALNHPDAAGLFADEDDRPWEPLNEGDPLNVGDEARQDRYGLTITGVVARVDGSGDPWTAEGAFIGLRHYGTWYVRRSVQELPTEDGTVIVPADGHEYITATFDGETYRAREAILLGSGHWQAAWRSDEGVMVYVIAEWIDPGTWKVEEK